IDFWPGPLDSTSCFITPTISVQYDHLWKINKQDVINFIAGAPATSDMISYPGNAPDGQRLAPFYDADGDGIYNSTNGDYPDFGLNGSPNCCNILHGDQAIWWVINDVCGPHTASGGSALGIQILCQAYAYNTIDQDINNTTFYQYQIKNCSSTQYNSVYFGFFIDADLGYYLDDYVGCDVTRGMGYAYNGDSNDDLPNGYGLNPPAIGIDFLHGPRADAADGIDNNRNCVIDESGEDIIMSKFVYYNNDFTVTGNPVVAFDYYNYLKGLWKDGTLMTYGGSGHLSGGPSCSFMFPGSSDHQYEWGTGGNCNTPAPAQPDWTEANAGNAPADRRFLMSAGPFTMPPGAVMDCITMAAIWARDMADPGPYYSLAALQTADDKVQMFFDSCYNVNILGIKQEVMIHASVFPNPTNDLLEVNFGQNISDGKFILYDIFGKAIKEVAVKNKTTINVSCKEFAAGIYVYKIILTDGKTGSGKVVIK
ncbi:MAG: T9SS type A sorting domain-containing protein, partial [Bacteroidia bacterium]|nr:T9SS type A sorting domain-containing protein [Bacteroidia bacterium]